MVTPFNQAIAGPDLHRADPSQFGGFCKIFLPSIGEDQKKSYDLSAGPLAGTAPYYSQSGPGQCITFIKRLYEGLR